MSSKIYEDATELVEKTEISHRHTFFQLKHFVLGKEITTQAKLQKCLKEIEARKETMDCLLLSIEETKDDIKLLELKLLNFEKKKHKADLNRQCKAIHIRKLDRKKISLLKSLDNLIKKLKEAEEETAFFLSAYKQLEKIEPLKRYDDPDSNAEYWNENFSQELQLRLLLQKPLDLELVKCILSLNKESPIRIEMIKILDQIQNKSLEHKSEKLEQLK